MHQETLVGMAGTEYLPNYIKKTHDRTTEEYQK